MQTQNLEEHHSYLRVLAFLSEQKIATASQIEKFCFPNHAKSFAWRTIKHLRDTKYISPTSLFLGKVKRPTAYSLTRQGLEDLRQHCPDDPGKMQIESNCPVHDVVLTDLRMMFSMTKECCLFLPENILASKIFENEFSELAIFRSLRSDAAILLSINGKNKWLSMEYERNQKSTARYKERLFKWYQADNLSGVLMVAENQNLIRHLSEIEQTIAPKLERKILYISKEEALRSSQQIQFHNSKNESLTFHLSNYLNTHYPILSRSSANVCSNS